jgi:hypothetical protein
MEPKPSAQRKPFRPRHVALAISPAAILQTSEQTHQYTHDMIVVKKLRALAKALIFLIRDSNVDTSSPNNQGPDRLQLDISNTPRLSTTPFTHCDISQIS